MSTPFTFPAQYAEFRRVEAKLKNVKDGEFYIDYSFGPSANVYRDNMTVLYDALVIKVGEHFADRFVNNIEDVYDAGYKQAALDCALRMKTEGMQIDQIIKYTSLTAEEIDRL